MEQPHRSDVATAVDRRTFMSYLAGLGAVGAALATALDVVADEGAPVTSAVLGQAAQVAGLDFTEAERDMMLKRVERYRRDYDRIRAVPLDNGVAPALVFDPMLGDAPPPAAGPSRRSRPRAEVAPADLEEVAFWPVTRLSELIRARKVTSEDLTRMYIARLKRFDPLLHCVITLTEERALAQAREADRELAEGRWRGPLHGVPWGAKDLLAVKGYPTTWGAAPYREQRLGEDATVVRRLDRAGAVLVAKLSMGALASGDVWFGGKTRTPWAPDKGSSGSSAGSASAVAAGLVGFAIGTETRGSILSPSTRCGATGLRPTFGRVSRHGAMALSWSMDKIGPICRSVEDCALVLDAIHGPDGLDETVVDAPFAWDAELDVTSLRVGVLQSQFEREPEEDDDREWHAFDLGTLDAVRGLGVELVPIELPDLPVGALGFILSAEAAAAFDELTRSGRDELLTRQDEYAWPTRFREARMIPAVEYIQANRVRRLAMLEMQRILAGLDAYISPTYGGDNLLLTNLTGHPAVVLPNGFRADGTPTSVTFMGTLFGEAKVLALARAYQEATGFHLRHPRLGA